MGCLEKPQKESEPFTIDQEPNRSERDGSATFFVD